MHKRLAKFVSAWGIYVRPFKTADIHDAMTEPGGVYITAFCQHCCKRVRHKLWFKRVRIFAHERYAYCMLCGTSWRYTGQRLSGLKNLD